MPGRELAQPYSPLSDSNR